jgi:hypothetical protein
MERKLRRGEAKDISCHRTDSPITGLTAYVLPRDQLEDGVAYCDAREEVWIWSIGRHRTTDEIHASVRGVHYQHPSYECLYLR